MKNKIELKLHTIILLVGPSNCGKSYFAKNILSKQLNLIGQKYDNYGSKKQLNVQYVSSDDIRRELIGNSDMDKYAPEMLQASEQAFHLLYNKVDFLSSYSINAEFIIIDTTGLNEDFRDKIKEIAKKNNYNVDVALFNYKNPEDYYKYISVDDLNRKIVKGHVEKLRKGVLPTLKRGTYNKIHTISSINSFPEYEISIENIAHYYQCMLSDDYEYTIISDVHCCIDELKELIQKHKCTIGENGKIIQENKKQRFVFVGDIIDKGTKLKETLEFVYANKDIFYFVLGNHENFIYKSLQQGIDKFSLPEETKRTQFNSYYELKDDEYLKEIFNDIVIHSYPFFLHRDFIVCHSPCEKKYLGKVDSISMKNQRNFRQIREKDFESHEKYIEYKEHMLDFLGNVSFNSKKVIFGHISFNNVYSNKAYTGIDTGCIYGNRLTSITFYNNGNKPYIISVDAKDKYIPNESLIDVSRQYKKKEISFSDLDDFEIKRLKFICDNKVNFISGTMSPSDKKENDIESLDKAFEYYKENNINEIVLQPKYMGSRCNIYLDMNDIKNSYATTRQGFVINYEDKKEKLIPIYEKLYNKIKDNNLFINSKLIIFDGELLPWRFLGAGLIDNNFSTITNAVETEYQFLKSNGFEDKLNEIDFQEFKKEKEYGESKKDLVEKYGSVKYETLLEASHVAPNHISIDEQYELLNIYKKQIELYGSETELEYKPFSILKIVYNDDSEKLFFDSNNDELFEIISDDKQCTINDVNNEEEVKKAYEYYNEITRNQMMEGCVIKPKLIYNKSIAPYLKCRNKNYLTLVYGYDYTLENKYSRLLRNKGIKNKLRISIKEFEIGKQMLEFPYSKINNDNNDYKQIVAQMILQEKQEKELDPRL
jgi:predicted kinase